MAERRGFSYFDGAVSVFWTFKVDSLSLGAFTSCEGLGINVGVETREEGGNNFFVHQLLGRLTYPNIKFSRPINQDSEKVAQWFMSVASGTFKRTNGEIVAKTPDDKVIARWSLMGVIPVRWSGPGFSAESPKVATETIEIAHQGFQEPAKGELKLVAPAAGNRAGR
ncbi:MAG: phage tail protein [Acidimicrobiia bacterium]